MAGEKGKGKRSVQEHRGEGSGSKLRKMTQGEMGIKRKEEKTEKGNKPRADHPRRMPEEKVNMFRMVVHKDFGAELVPKELEPDFPGVNEMLGKLVKGAKESAARLLKEYEAKGYIEYPDFNSPPNVMKLIA